MTIPDSILSVLSDHRSRTTAELAWMCCGVIGKPAPKVERALADLAAAGRIVRVGDEWRIATEQAKQKELF